MRLAEKRLTIAAKMVPLIPVTESGLPTTSGSTRRTISPPQRGQLCPVLSIPRFYDRIRVRVVSPS